MARADTETLLPLDTFAKIMGLNPMHWNGATANSLADGQGIMKLSPNSCDSVWWQHPWQNSKLVGRETIAQQIAVAEVEIAQQLGYLPAPNWVVDEFTLFPQPFDPEWYGQGYDVRLQRSAIKARWGKIIAGGRRATTLIDNVGIGTGGGLQYTDEDDDGLFETATITVTTTVTDVNELKVYFADKSADEIWEIRPVRSKSISSGTATIVIDAWLLIDPDLWEQFPPGGGLGAIDISDETNYAEEVDVYRVYNDTTQASVVFYWRDPCNLCGGSGCAACQETTQNGCFTILDDQNSVVAPFAATYDETNAQWTKAAWTESRAPDRVQLYYYAGERAARFLKGRELEPMPLELAQAISYMATARLLGGLCACVNTSALVEWLQEDVSRLSQGASFFTPQEILLNPFGTRRGEVIAYKKCRAPQKHIAKMAMV